MQSLLVTDKALDSVRRTGNYTRATRVLGLLTALLGLMVIAGWHMHIDVLVQIGRAHV